MVMPASVALSPPSPAPVNPGCKSGCDQVPEFDRLINLSRLQELLDEIGTKDLSEIIGTFLEETDVTLSRIVNSAGGPQLSEDLHFLKGCALNLGLPALATLCHDAERCNACSRSTPLNAVFFAAVYEASKRALSSALEGEPVR